MTTYAPPPGAPPTASTAAAATIIYDPPPGPPPWLLAPPPPPPPLHTTSAFPSLSLSPSDIHTLSTQGYTTFSIASQRPHLHSAALALFSLSKQFFDLPQSDKEQFIVRESNIQGSEEGWSRIVGEKELLTIRRGGAECPNMMAEEAQLVWEECGKLMKEIMAGVEESLGLERGAFDAVVVPECRMPQAGEERVETLLRMFRYERRLSEEETADSSESSQPDNGSGRLVAEPHRDLGLLSLVIGSSPGLEVWDTNVGNWISIEKPPYASSSSSSPGDLTATLLVGDTLTNLTNGRYFPGRHRVFVPPFSPDLKEDQDSHAQYRFSLVFALRPHPKAIISTSTLTSSITGPFMFPIEGVKGGQLFNQISKNKWNINTGKKMREQQRMRLQSEANALTSSNATPAENS